jgi:hypothetical protein
MIGYDRPLKPEWIYKTLQLVETGKKPEYYYDLYNRIAVELTGKDGIRKTRTVLFRTFIFSFQENTSVIEPNMLLSLCKEKSIEYMKPIILSKFIMDYDILKYFTQKLFQIFDPSQVISSNALTAKIVEKYGDTEIVKRSTRSFLKTLCEFDIIEPINQNNYHQLPKKLLTADQVCDILKLYAVTFHTKQIDIRHINKSIFDYYQFPNLSTVAKQFNNIFWEYVKGVDRELLMFK